MEATGNLLVNGFRLTEVRFRFGMGLRGTRRRTGEEHRQLQDFS